MDRMIYVSMSGAKALMQRQEAISHNLANVSTDGFRADMMAFRAVPGRQDQTATTRVWNMEASAGYDGASGPIRQTGRALDVAVRGNGWIAVQAADGTEAYTRDGGLEVNVDGTLMTRRGNPVMGDGGPIVVPPNSSLSIGTDGTVSARQAGQPVVPVGRIKLVNPEHAELSKGPDGLMRMVAGGEAPLAETVRLADGVLEGSNVNVVEAMVGMISVARQFEVQMRLLQTAEQNEQKAAQLLSVSA